MGYIAGIMEKIYCISTSILNPYSLTTQCNDFHCCLFFFFFFCDWFTEWKEVLMNVTSLFQGHSLWSIWEESLWHLSLQVGHSELRHFTDGESQRKRARGRAKSKESKEKAVQWSRDNVVTGWFSQHLLPVSEQFKQELLLPVSIHKDMAATEWQQGDRR